MAQHVPNVPTEKSLQIGNQSGAEFRGDLNGALEAIATNNSGAAEPSAANSYPYQWYADSATNQLKIRNSSGTTTWHVVGDLDETNLGLATAASPTFTGTANFETIVASGSTGHLRLQTTQNASGLTNVDFTDIPSWVKRITVMIDRVSISNSEEILLQLGTSSSFVGSGYLSRASTGTSGQATTSGFLLEVAGIATDNNNGICTLCTMGGNRWVMSAITAAQLGTGNLCAGVLADLGGTLTRIRLTSTNAATASGVFDNGSFNIMYEG